MEADAPGTIIDTPNSHGMFMLGTTSLYLCHMPMFMKEDHCYQVTLRARLDAGSWATYLEHKRARPTAAFNLINADSDKFTLPDVASGKVSAWRATIYDGYSNANGGTPGNVLVENATVTVDGVIHFRHFNQDIPRPAHLTYVLFGDGVEAHLDHYIAREPDFQHLLTLPAVPAWLPREQLAVGVAVSVVGAASEPIPCHAPLSGEVYDVLYEGNPSAKQSLRVGPAATIWYSTGNLLNMKDPCDGKDC